MKRITLLKYLRKHDCEFLREGKRYTVYVNREASRSSTIPRHTEISDNLARKICKDLGIPPL